MNDDYQTVTERITTADDGPETVNERLTDGGPGPEGQPDTVTERLSGAASEAAEPSSDDPDNAPAKKAAPRRNAKR